MEERVVRAKKSLFEILSTLRKLRCNSSEIFFKLFDTQVVPTLLYASEIWGYEKYEQVERVHLHACKRFLHVTNKTPNNAVYGELGRLITSTMRVIKYWFKLLKQPDNVYSRKAYTLLTNMHDRGYTTWVTRVKQILCAHGFEQVWLFGCGNENGFFSEFKDRLCSSFCFIMSLDSF